MLFWEKLEQAGGPNNVLSKTLLQKLAKEKQDNIDSEAQAKARREKQQKFKRESDTTKSILFLSAIILICGLIFLT